MEKRTVTRPVGGEWEVTQTPKRFRLVRIADDTGISGAGHVADGVQFPDGTCVLRWRVSKRSTAFYDSIKDLEAVHGHGSKTVVVWLDSCHDTVQFCVVCAADHNIVGHCAFCGAGNSTVTLPTWAVASIWERAAEWGRARPDREGRAIRAELQALRRIAGVPACRGAEPTANPGEWRVYQPSDSTNTARYVSVYIEAESMADALQKSVDRLPWIEFPMVPTGGENDLGIPQEIASDPHKLTDWLRSLDKWLADRMQNKDLPSWVGNKDGKRLCTRSFGVSIVIGRVRTFLARYPTVVNLRRGGRRR